MQDAYPELNETADRVSKTVHAEEARFAHTLVLGAEARRMLRESLTDTNSQRGRELSAIATEEFERGRA